MNSTNFNDKDLALIKRTSAALREIEADLNRLFPERQWLIRQIIYCLVTGRNLLIYGVHGTAKTLLAMTLFDCIKGRGQSGEEKRVFEIQLDNETSLDDIVGPTNIPLLEKEGRLEHFVDGYMPTAHFVFLDEFFEAVSVLRAINDMLNEKHLMSGAQSIHVPLMTAVATTNRSPESIETMYPALSLQSTDDRFLCIADVTYLKTDDGQEKMLENYVDGAGPKASVDFADLQRMVSLINSTNQWENLGYLSVYQQVMSKYNEKLKAKGEHQISDRRIAWLTQLVEAEAMLNGRVKLALDDILATAYGLCRSEDDAKLFLQTATTTLEKAKKDFNENVDEVERNQLERIESELGSIVEKMKDPAFVATNAPVGAAVKRLATVKRELATLTPQLGTNLRKKEELLKLVDLIKEKLDKILEQN